MMKWIIWGAFIYFFFPAFLFIGVLAYVFLPGFIKSWAFGVTVLIILLFIWYEWQKEDKEEDKK